MSEPDKPKVDFGYQRVSPSEKTRRVEAVFSSVAARYDLMNDLMSFGSHRLMKRMLLEMSGLKPGAALLDVAGGTGDIAALGSAIVGSQGCVVLSDINATMLAVGRDRLLDDGISNVSLCQADAQALPFGNASFDCLTIGFGLRNVTDKERALREMWRVLRPGGVLLILEFSHIENPLLRTAYQGFQALWPSAGRLLVGDADAYTYLVESIRVHPKQRALKLMISDAGFTKVEYHNLAGGAAAIHRAEVPQDNG
jgi:demethylmenaquinone methyltransferase/2-methoxy-6-polyprenyl-1,4-benzoquinol methylase